MSRFERFMSAVDSYYSENKKVVRYGQAICNTLKTVWPDLDKDITGDTLLDPYFDDNKIPVCLVYLQGRFEGGL